MAADHLACALAGCPNAPIVQWQRRSTTDPTHTDAVYACSEHPISLDLASLIHAPSCTAPDPAHLPACGCTPEPLPQPEPDLPPVTLPTGWTVPAS